MKSEFKCWSWLHTTTRWGSCIKSIVWNRYWILSLMYMSGLNFYSESMYLKTPKMAFVQIHLFKFMAFMEWACVLETPCPKLTMSTGGAMGGHAAYHSSSTWLCHTVCHSMAHPGFWLIEGQCGLHAAHRSAGSVVVTPMHQCTCTSIHTYAGLLSFYHQARFRFWLIQEQGRAFYHQAREEQAVPLSTYNTVVHLHAVT